MPSYRQAYGGEAVKFKEYVAQRLLPKVLDWKTPHEVLYNKPPEFDDYHEFGCTAYVLKPEAERTQIGPRSIKCKFVGYEENGKCYRFWDSDQRRIIRSRNAVFVESRT